MAKETTYAGKLGDLARMGAALAANAAELPHLEGVRTRFEATLIAAQEAAKQQAAFTASKQEASKRLVKLVSEGNRLANGVRILLKEHYGIRSEKLAEFNLQPFRGRVVTLKVKKPGLPNEPTPVPPAPTDSNL
jgi:hypothetical protein